MRGAAMTMTIVLYLTAAIAAYLLCAVNPAIVLSRLVYHTDIREKGSGNPGFTNFKRTFGGPWAWVVLLCDLTKAALVIGVFSLLFDRYGLGRQWGAAYTGLFAMLGHAYPVFYHFRGGKGFLVSMSLLWCIDWRAGLFSFAVLCVLLLATKYMSLSTVASMTCGIFVLILLKTPWNAVCAYAAAILFMAYRHRENFKRLKNGTEAKFSLR